MSKRLDLRAVVSANAQAGFGALSLLLLLAYTWSHTGALLARYINPDVFGYACAAGIELAIVSLSLRISDERRRGGSGGLFVGVLVAVLVVSAFANVAEGYATAYAETMTVAALAGIDPLQAVIGIAATGLISVIVFALADIIGGDVRKAAQASERAERKERKDAEGAAQPAGGPAESSADMAQPAAQIIRLPEPPSAAFRCACGVTFAKQQQLAAHMRRCAVASAQRTHAGRPA